MLSGLIGYSLVHHGLYIYGSALPLVTSLSNCRESVNLVGTVTTNRFITRFMDAGVFDAVMVESCVKTNDEYEQFIEKCGFATIHVPPKPVLERFDSTLDKNRMPDTFR